MKKILSIALVALLATSAVFAGFSGSAKINLGVNFDDGAWGFANSTELGKLDITWQSETAEKVGEGDIYAGIKASFKITSSTAKAEKFDDAVALKISGSVSEAYVTDGSWKVSILGAMSAADFAKSAIDKSGNNAVTYAPVAKAAPGFKVTTADGYSIGVGAAGNYKTDVADWSVAVTTPEYTLAEGLTAKFAAAAADGVDVAASASVAYAGDISAKAAADFGINTESKAYDFDVAANAVIAPVTVDAYYNYGKDLLSAKAAATIDVFTVAAVGKDLLNAQDLSAEVSATIEGVKGKVYGGYTLSTKAWKAGAEASYDIFAASVDVAAKTVKVKASASSKDIIPGATVGLAYVSGNLVDKAYGSVDATLKIAF